MLKPLQIDATGKYYTSGHLEFFHFADDQPTVEYYEQDGQFMGRKRYTINGDGCIAGKGKHRAQEICCEFIQQPIP